MPTSDAFLQETLNGGGDPILTILEVSLDGNLYHFVNNTEDVQSNASGTLQTYRRSAFELSLPDDTEEGTPKATLNFGVADTQIVRALRATEEPMQASLWLILASDPNTVEYGPASYQSASFTVSTSSVQVELEVEPILQLEVPAERFTPNSFPGLFEVVE